MTEPTKMSLADVAAQFGGTDAAFKYFHGKLFTYIPPDHEKFAEFVTSIDLPRKAFPNSHPATVIVGRLGPLISKQSRLLMTVEDQQLRILGEVNDLKLPDADYLALISPAEMSGTGTDYALAYQSIDFLRSFIALFFGKLPFYSWIADFEFDAGGAVSLPGEALRMPLYADVFKIGDPELAKEMTARLALQLPEYRQRLQRAADFLDRAMDQKDEAFRFSSYWIALEIIVGGTADAVRATLAKAYGQDNKAFADQHLFFKEIEDARHNLIHKGVFGTMRSYHERLLQLYFWDIVIFQIGLKSRDLAMALAKSGMVEEEQQKKASSPPPAPA